MRKRCSALAIVLAGCSISTQGRGPLVEQLADAGDVADAIAADPIAADSAIADTTPGLDAGTDARLEPDAGGVRIDTALDVEAHPYTDGVVCNPTAAIVRDGVSAGLARASSGGADVLDGQDVSACLEVRFDRAATLEIRIVARAAGAVCGESCTAFCGTGRELDVFVDEQYTATLKLGGELLEHQVEAGRELAIVTVCRTGQGAARDHVEIDSVEAVR